MNNFQIEKSELIGKLKKMKAFLNIDDFHLDSLSVLFEYQGYETREVIINEGDADTNFYIILKGQIDVMIKRDNDNPVFIDSIRQGNIFGESAIFSDVKRTATISARVDSQLIKIDAIKFKEFLKEQPDIGVEIMLAISYGLLNKLKDAGRDLAFAREMLLEEDEKKGNSAANTASANAFNQVFSNLDII